MKIDYFHNMKNLWVFGLLLLIFQACTLSASQEASLNSAKTSFIKSKNEGMVMSYVAFTLPEVVSYYKNQSDSSFQQKFNLSENNRVSLTNSNVKKVKRDEDVIHEKYDFYDSKKVVDERQVIFALSKNNGKSWFFIDRIDYFNNNIFPENKRLISNE